MQEIMKFRPSTKILGFFTASGILGLVFGYLIWRILYSEDLLIQPQTFILPAVVFLAWGASTSLLFLITGRFQEVLIFLSLLLAIFILFFGSSFFQILGALLFLILSFLSWRIIHLEKEQRLQIRIAWILRRGLPIFLTALAFLISLAYFFSPAGLKTEVQDIVLPRGVFNFLIKPIENLALEHITLYKKGMLAEEFLMKVDIIGKIQKQEVSPEILSELQKAGLLTKEGIKMEDILQNQKFAEVIESKTNKDLASPAEREKIRSEYSEKLGIKIEENDTFLDFLYKLTNHELNTFKKQYEGVLPAALAIGLFLTLKAISFPFMWIIILLTILIFKLLTALKVIKIEELEARKEIITF